MAFSVRHRGIDVIGDARKRFGFLGQDGRHSEVARAKVEDVLGGVGRRNLDFRVCRRVRYAAVTKYRPAGEGTMQWGTDDYSL